MRSRALQTLQPLLFPSCKAMGASATAAQTLLVQKEVRPHVTVTLAPALCPTGGRGTGKPSREDTESLSLLKKHRAASQRHGCPAGEELWVQSRRRL